jgi:type I restriction enzyme S subunit
VNEEQRELPRGWVEVPVSEIAQLIRGVSYEKSVASDQFKEGYLPILRATNIQDEHLILDADLVYVPKEYVKPEQILESADVVICMSSGSKHLVGKTAQFIHEWQGSFGVFCAVARLNRSLNRRFAGYFFSSPRYRMFIRDKSSGVNINNLRHSDIENLLFPIAPLPEQQRIVAAIEQQFTRLDAAVAALKRVQIKLKRYRAAVLKAAVEGKLTEEWRAGHPATESASLLLERILNERRAKWEADLRAKGKDPAKVKYVEPAKPDTESLPELPEGWCWATVDQTAATEPNSITDGPFGSNLKTEHYRNSGGRVIRLQNIGDGEFKDEKAFIALEHFEMLKKHRVFAGDLAIAALGENPPRSCIIPDFVGPAIVKADCIRFKVSPSILNSFVNCVLNAEPARKRTASQLHGIGRPRLNLTEIKSMMPYR